MLQQKTGSVTTSEDLHNGSNRTRIEIPGLDLKRTGGQSAERSWHQDGNGDILLSDRDTPSDVDDRYLTRRGYWQPNFDGATVSVLPPGIERDRILDGVRFRVSGGAGFTLWINRTSGLLERIDGTDPKEFGDYRSVQGILLPFVERYTSGDGRTITFTRRTCQQHANPAAFAIPFQTDYHMPASGVVTVPTEHGLGIEAKLNGEGPFRAIFDTGAVNFMSTGLARKIGLVPDNKDITFGTSSPATMQVHTVKVDTLQIGDLVARNQIFYVGDLPDDGGVPTLLVGYELLRRFAVRIDYERQQITFYDGPHFHYTGNAAPVPVTFRGNGLIIDASLDDTTGPFILDTGNESGSVVNSGFTTKNNLVQRLGAHLLAYNGRGLAGPSPEAYLVRTTQMRLGSIPVSSIILHLETDPSDKNPLAGNIGQNILTRFTEIFDCMRGRIYFETNDRSKEPEVFNRAGLILDSFGHGLQIMSVLPASPAEEAGLKKGDVVTAIDSQPVSDDDHPAAFYQSIGTVVTLSVQHSDQSARQIKITLRDVL